MLFLGKRIMKKLAVAAMAMIALLKVHSVAAMGVSMLVSVGAYAIAFGVPFAVGFVLLLFVHEIGHVIAARAVGIRALPPVFIPFLGAAVRLKSMPMNAKMEANIAIGGPAMGTLSALLCLAWYFWTDSAFSLLLAYTACLLNLFNLIPSDPLDGGKIAMAISPYLWWMGTVTVGSVFFYTQNSVIFLILLFSLSRLWQVCALDHHTNYFRSGFRQRFTVFCWYVGLIAVLGITTVYIGQILNI